MKRRDYDSELKFLGALLAHHPYMPLSAVAHAVLLALLFYFGSYQLQVQQRQEEVASSLRATSMAGTAKRLQDLETIKQLLEKSANRVDPQPAERNSTPSALPETPAEMVELGRELSQAIDALDEEIRAEELAELLGEPKPPPTVAPAHADAPPPPIPDPGPQASSVTAESAAQEVAALEARARDTLARRQMLLEAKANGVQVEGVGTDPRQGATGGGVLAGTSGDSSSEEVRAEIAAFIDTGVRGGESARFPTGIGARDDIVGSGDMLVPAVDADALVRGQGRMVGPGGDYANRLYITGWYIIGPFQGGSRGRLRGNPIYPPEKAVLLDAVYFGKGERLLKWRYVSSPSYPLVPPDSAEDSVYYGYTEVSVDEDCDLLAWFGADDDAQVYVNDRPVWPGGSVRLMQYVSAIWAPGTNHRQDYNFTEGQRVVHFNKGRNKVFFKLTNGAQGTHLSFVLTR
jgi:hypothetical protein